MLMFDLPSQVEIHLTRNGKKDSITHEDLIEDTDTCLRTVMHLTPTYSREWSPGWWELGLVPKGRLVRTVRKHLFYNEYFSIMELYGAAGDLLGYFCSVTTPLSKVEGRYYLKDLHLSLWITPNRSLREPDMAEFNKAVRRGRIPSQLQATARQTLERMKVEAVRGILPGTYISINGSSHA